MTAVVDHPQAVETVDDHAERGLEQAPLRGRVRVRPCRAVDPLEQLRPRRPRLGVDREEDALVLADRDVADRQPIRQDFLQAAFGQDPSVSNSVPSIVPASCLVSRWPSHLETGTDTEFPMSFHL